jgi:hypothetical protein
MTGGTPRVAVTSGKDGDMWTSFVPQNFRLGSGTANVAQTLGGQTEARKVPSAHADNDNVYFAGIR